MASERVTAAQVQAARARLALDRKLDRSTPDWVIRLARDNPSRRSSSSADSAASVHDANEDADADETELAVMGSAIPSRGVGDSSPRATGRGAGVAQAAQPSTAVGTKQVAQYEETPLADLADAPVSALQGISDGDAQHLKDALNVRTVRDLGTNKYFLWAQAITRLAD